LTDKAWNNMVQRVKGQDAYYKLVREVKRMNKSAPNIIDEIKEPDLLQQLNDEIKIVKPEYHVHSEGGFSNKVKYIKITGQNFGTTLTEDQAAILAACLIKAIRIKNE
jgi:hypothetical protein